MPHVQLQSVARDHLVERRGAAEVPVVAAQRHQLGRVLHVGARVRDLQPRPAEEEGRDALFRRRDPRDGDGLFREPRDRHEVVLLHVRRPLRHQAAHERGVRGRRLVQILHVLEAVAPVRVAEARRRRSHLPFAPDVFALCDPQQLLGGIRDHLRLELHEKPVAPDRLADDRVFAAAADDCVADLLFELLQRAVERRPRPGNPEVKGRVVARVEVACLADVLPQLADPPRGSAACRLRVSVAVLRHMGNGMQYSITGLREAVGERLGIEDFVGPLALP